MLGVRMQQQRDRPTLALGRSVPALKTPFGADGTITMRADDQTAIGYAIGWGVTIPKDPFVEKIQTVDWKTILQHEAEWKKKMGYA